MHIGRKQAIQHALSASGVQRPGYIFFMISTAADLAAAAVNELPPDVRKIVEAHFFEGESIFTIQRRYKIKRRDLDALIEAALVSMRAALGGVGAFGPWLM